MISVFYPQFRVLSPILHFILNSAFYPQFRVLSSIPVPYSGSAFQFRIPVPHSGSVFRFKVVSNECLYIVELTVGYESNLYNNVKRKQSKYSELTREQNEKFKSVKFVNLSISSLGVFANECSTFIEMLHDLGIEYNYEKYIIRRMTTIAIRTTYYIFCCRNKEWSSPELLTF